MKALYQDNVIRLRVGTWAPLTMFRAIVRLIEEDTPEDEFRAEMAGYDWQLVRDCLEEIRIDEVLTDDQIELAVSYTIAEDCEEEMRLEYATAGAIEAYLPDYY